MMIKDVKSIKPLQDRVVVELFNVEDVLEDLIANQESDAIEPAVRYGEVISIGQEVHKPEHCSSVEVGDIVAFTEFAGYHLPVEEKVCKIIRGYDILGMCKEMKDIGTIGFKPSADRLLLEIFDPEEDGDIIDTTDPRETTLKYGTVITLGPDTKINSISEGMVIAYEPYSGETIRERTSSEDKELCIVPEQEILLIKED